MEDVSEFLRARGVQEETILQMEEQKIDSDVIGLMDDATLQKYIPSYGDRIAIFNYCRIDTDELLEVLDSYGCRRKVTAENLPKIIEEIAPKEMVQKPMFVIDCWREIYHQPGPQSRGTD
ncbi:hypothetical protein NQZ68_031269 [Dissostichus eleginoides]|nr:hypothetical protein NQZ68_031269 [Dissostichus eleginoides]